MLSVRKLGKPPHLIMRIMDCVIILFQKRIDPVTADPDKPCPKPSWGEALKVKWRLCVSAACGCVLIQAYLF